MSKQMVPVELESGDIRLLAECGVLLRAAGRQADAAEVFEALCALRPNAATAWLELGKTRLQAGDLQTAEAHYVKALSLDEKNAAAYSLLGEAALLRADGQAAREFLQSALQYADDEASAAFAQTLKAEAERLHLL